MRYLNIACYCVNFNDYDFLYEILRKLSFAGVGAELSMFTDDMDFMVQLLGERRRFAGYPITFHGPYMEVEATAKRGSLEYLKILDAYEMAFEVYRKYDAKSIVMHTNQRGFDMEEKKELQDNAVNTIGEIAKRAEKEGIQLLVENVGESIHGNLLFDEEDFIYLFQWIPSSVGCLIDIGHAVLNRWNLERVIKELNGRICSYHLHNNDGSGDTHRPLFEKNLLLGKKELPQLIRCMEQETPDADWILEYAPGGHISVDLLEREVRKVLQLRAEAKMTV